MIDEYNNTPLDPTMLGTTAHREAEKYRKDLEEKLETEALDHNQREQMENLLLARREAAEAAAISRQQHSQRAKLATSRAAQARSNAHVRRV